MFSARVKMTGSSRVFERLAGDEYLYPAALAILHKVHSRGVIHGDVRYQNFVVSPQGSLPAIWLLDFSHCVLSHDEEKQQDDLNELHDLFTNLEGWPAGH